MVEIVGKGKEKIAKVHKSTRASGRTQLGEDYSQKEEFSESFLVNLRPIPAEYLVCYCQDYRMVR